MTNHKADDRKAPRYDRLQWEVFVSVQIPLITNDFPPGASASSCGYDPNGRYRTHPCQISRLRNPETTRDFSIPALLSSGFEINCESHSQQIR